MTLDAAALLERAREVSGVDIDDPDAHEPLEALVVSLNEEAHLSPEGVVEMERRLLRILANRLRIERDFAKYPEIADETVAAPVVITGLGRSGTTKIQKMLAACGDFTGLPLWMAFNPALVTGDRGENPRPRVAETDRFVEWVDRTSPKVRVVHSFDTWEVEETNPIQEHSLLSNYLLAFANVPSYIQWIAARSPEQQIRFMHRVLQYLQWQFDVDRSQPWVLKNPMFLGMESLLTAVFPGVRIIATHRAPVATIPSSASLIVAMRALYSDVDMAAAAGPYILEGFAAQLDQHLRNRQADPGLEVLDIAYADLVDDASAVLERVYDHLGRELSDQARDKCVTWEAANRQHRFGRHDYSLEQYGLESGMVEQRLGHYLRDFGSFVRA